MDTASVQARIEHESAELRALYPHVRHCHAALLGWREPAGTRYALRLDIRWPDHQTLLSGEAQDEPGAAITAGFRAAIERLREAAWARR